VALAAADLEGLGILCKPKEVEDEDNVLTSPLSAMWIFPSAAGQSVAQRFCRTSGGAGTVGGSIRTEKSCSPV
jgi:hypothetical protein